MKLLFCATVLQALSASMSLAQPTENLGEALSRLIGSEIEATGHIGTGLDFTDPEAVFFADANKTTFPVVFDAGREARRKLQDCKFAMFGGTPCPATVHAEIELDGSRIRLIVFKVVSIGAPSAY